MENNKVKMIKITKNSESLFKKLDKVKEIYNLATYPKAIEYLCNIAIKNNSNFKK